MVNLFNSRETEFNSLGEGILSNITSISVATGVNKEDELSIVIKTDRVDERIVNEKILSYKDRQYFIRKVTQSVNDDYIEIDIKAVEIISLVDFIRVRGMEKYGSTAYEILKQCVAEQYLEERYNTQAIRLLEDTELPNGYTWIRKPIDFKVNASSLGDVIGSIIKLTGGELYSKGFGIAIITRLGTDKGVTIKEGIDFNNLSIEFSSDKMLNRLVPLGQGDMTIKSIMQDNKEYIDSYNISEYGLREGYQSYSTDIVGEFGGASMLYNEAIKSFSNPIVRTNGNYDNTHADIFTDSTSYIDEPDVAISLQLLTNGQEKVERGLIGLGDVIQVVSVRHNIRVSARVTDIRNDVMNNRIALTLNNPLFNVMSRLGSTIGVAERLEKMLDTNGNIKGQYTNLSNGMVQVTIQDSQNSVNQTVVADWCSTPKLFKTGNKLMFIGDGIIATIDTSNGNTNWTTLASNGTFVLGDGVSGKLYTNQVEITSKDGTLSLKDNLLDIKMINGLSAIQLGLDPITNKAIFNIYDRIGNKVMYYDNEELCIESSLYGNVYRGLRKADYKSNKDANWQEITGESNRWVHRIDGKQYIKQEMFISNGEVIEVIGTGWGDVIYRKYDRAFYDDQVVITKSQHEYKIEWLNPVMQGNTSITMMNNDIVFKTPDCKDGITLSEIIRAIRK